MTHVQKSSLGREMVDKCAISIYALINIALKKNPVLQPISFLVS